ncbi:NSFL1 cofactor p47 [Armigeres subalbatus]|uniref:NSFL1 cofactor p47 n=1 Tax=Armigeres subalbatus TaxID=124917 RepID=UPI002ED66776
MSEREELIKQFSDVTGVAEDRAKFYLEAANGELQVALSSFYEGDNEGDRPVVAIDDDDDDSDDDNVTMDSVHLSRSEAKSKTKKAPKSSNIATLSSLNDSPSEDEEEHGQAFYAGGSERSGQQVLGPPKKNPIKDYVSEIFRSAQQGHLETFEGEASSSSSSLYAGTGYRLGQTDNDHQAIPDRQRSSARDGDHNHEVVTLTLWRQGFSINNGELRRYEDSANKEFFESIMRGEIPPELRSKGPTMIHLDLKDNRHEDYVKRSAPFRAFGGGGQTLGSPAPNVVESAPAAAGNSEENEKKALSSLQVDESQPTTNLQIRLADGSRLSARFNQSHTIENVRQYITNARPQYATQSFALMTTFPPKELADGSQSLKDAGLLNSAIMQRMK